MVFSIAITAGRVSLRIAGGKLNNFVNPCSAFAAAAKYWREHRDDVYEDPEKGDIPVSEWWDDFAQEPGQEKIDVFGGTYAPTGYNWFLTYAMLQSMQSEAPMILPPTDPEPSLWPSWRVTFYHTGGAFNSYFHSSTTSVIQGTVPWITCRIQYNTSAGPVVGPFLFIKADAYNTALSLASFQTPLESVFGSIPESTRAYFSVRFRIPDGRISAAETFSLLTGTAYDYTAP